jgi:RNA polymerase sigma factor (TIGR02999 family)
MMSDVTQILSDVEQGDPAAADKLLPLIYDELRRLAARKLAKEKPGQTLETTDLVHEAYSRLVDHDKARHWDSRRHFFAAAAEAMRRILIEQARRKASARHGGGRARVTLDESAVAVPESGVDILALNEALERLRAEDPRKAELVKLRYFAGMTIAEAAEVLGISHATAERDWVYSRLRLFQWMKGPSV